MKIFKKIAVRVIPVGLLVFSAAALTAYQRGVFDITFIERPDESTVVSDTVSTAPDMTDSSSSASTDTTGNKVSDSIGTPVVPPATDGVTDFLNSLSPTASALSNGFTVTDEVFSDGMKLTLLDPEATLGKNFSLRNRESVEYTRVPNEKYGGYTTESSAIYTERPLVEVYMDYIVIDNGSSAELLTRDGRIFFYGFDIDYYAPAYTRNTNDIPQFKETIPPKTKNGLETYKYYMFDADGNFVESNYNDAAENRGLYFNYPSYFGKSDSTYTRSWRDGAFGFANGKIGVVSGYRFDNAFEFSEGLAAVERLDEVLDKKVLSYVDTRWQNKITGSASSWNHGPYYNLSGRRVSSVYRLPDTRGVESLGFIYFDHGLCRIRRQEYDYYHTYDSLAYDYAGHHYILCCTDEDLVMRIDGTLWDVPGGFTVKAYSDGIFLLERDGLYGFMDYTGKWIAQPVYDYAEPFCEGLAVLGSNGKRGMIDVSGNIVVPIVFDYIQSCSGGIIAAWDEANGWHILNKVK